MMKKLSSISGLLALLALASVPAAWAQQSITVPLELEHLSNPSLAAESPGSVILLRLSPRYEFESTDGARRSVLALGVSLERSSNTALAANRNNPLIDYRLEIAAPLSSLAFRVGLEDASSRNSEFRDFGRVTVDSRQRTIGLSTSWTKELTPTAGLELEASHARVSFDNDLLSGYRENVLAATVTLQQSERANWLVETRAARLQPGGDDDALTRVGLAMGYDTSLSDAVTLRARVGMVRVRPSGDGAEPTASLSMTYTAERLSTEFGVSREVGAVGTEGRYATTDSIQGALSYPVTPNTTLSAGASHAQTRDLFRESGTSTYLRLRSELTPHWAVGMGVEQRRARPRGLPSARSLGVGLTLTYSHPNL